MFSGYVVQRLKKVNDEAVEMFTKCKNGKQFFSLFFEERKKLLIEFFSALKNHSHYCLFYFLEDKHNFFLRKRRIFPLMFGQNQWINI